MFKPVRPVMLADDPDDPRPALGPAMFSSRVEHVGIAEGDYKLKLKDGKLIPYFEPHGRLPSE
jgi:hypothetical protein